MNLKSLIIYPQPGNQWLDTTIAAHRRTPADFALPTTPVIAATLGDALPAFAAAAGWLIAKAHAGGWHITQIIVEPAGEMRIGAAPAPGEHDTRPILPTYSLAMTQSDDNGAERTEAMRSDEAPAEVRDAIAALWRFFA